MPGLSAFVDLLDMLRGKSQLFFGYVACDLGYVVPCVHMRLQRSQDNHLTLQSLHVFHLLNDDRNRPYPVSKDKEKSVEQLQARIVWIKLAYLCKHDRDGSSS